MARNETLRTCHRNGHLRLQTRGELSRDGWRRADHRPSLSLFPLRARPAGRYDVGETQFTYSVKAIVIMLLTTARGATPRRIGARRRVE